MKKIFVEGHRGYCAKYPENTLVSYEAAIDLGVDAFEFDVRLSKDKIPVIMHDANARRTCGVDRKLCDMTHAEIKELEAAYTDKFGDEFVGKEIRVPTLKELCELVSRKRPNMPLGVEIKDYTEETVDIAVAILKEYGLFDNSWFYAFDAPTIKYLKTKYNARTMGYPDFQMKRFDHAEGYRYYDEIGLNMSIVKSEVFPIFASKGLPMHMYCADTEEDVMLCIEKGAQLITANDPVPLINIVKKQGD